MQPRQTTDQLACTLMEEELIARRQFVRRTIKPHISSVQTEALSLTIGFGDEIEASQIEEFVALERLCCAFLTFNIVSQNNAIELQISGPEGSEDVLQMFVDGAHARRS